MRDKFKENIRIALPAALIAIVIFAFNNTTTQVPETGPINWLKVLQMHHHPDSCGIWHECLCRH